MTILEFMLSNEDYLRDFITRSTYHSNAISNLEVDRMKKFGLKSKM